MAAAVIIALIMALAVPQTSAHESIVRPDRMEAVPGSTVPLQAFSAHTFFAKSEELEPANEVEVSVVAGSKRTPVALTANAQTLAYVGAATAPSRRHDECAHVREVRKGLSERRRWRR
jgi:hypothetical protein